MASADFVIAQKLREARAMIVRGWVQCSFSNENGVCILGALNRTKGIRFGDPMGARAQELLKACVRSDFYGSLMFWNDAEGRTVDEVLAVFDGAIELAERGKPVPDETWTKLDAYLSDIETVSA